MSNQDHTKIIMTAIYAARLNPKIKMMGVYKDLAKELGYKNGQIIQIVSRLEGEGYLNCSGRQTIVRPVLTKDGRDYVENSNKNMIDKLITIANNGWPAIMAALFEQAVKAI